jgi:uncharacterized protein
VKCEVESGDAPFSSPHNLNPNPSPSTLGLPEMHLTDDQRQHIRDAGLRHFGVIPRLFGYRLDDTKRGGDIDLFIPGDRSAEEAVIRRLRFCAELRTALGERRIDVLVETQQLSAIQDQAKRMGEPV